jgi:hypothetical protein
MNAHALKLSLGLLFGISNILSLGWGNSRTHLSKNEKKWKNVDDHGSTHKKNSKRKKSRAKNGLFKKKYISDKLKRQISSTVLPILFDSRKEG